jgi:hypothetical protein
MILTLTLINGVMVIWVLYYISHLDMPIRIEVWDWNSPFKISLDVLNCQLCYSSYFTISPLPHIFVGYCELNTKDILSENFNNVLTLKKNNGKVVGELILLRFQTNTKNIMLKLKN